MKNLSDKRKREQVIPMLLLWRIVEPHRNDSAQCESMTNDLQNAIQSMSEDKIFKQAKRFVESVIEEHNERPTATLLWAYHAFIEAIIETQGEIDGLLRSTVEGFFEIATTETANEKILDETQRSGSKLGLKWFQRAQAEGMYPKRVAS